ncbi:MAG: PTS transporter subunit EIIB [Erysipelotrichaceae bacterium]|nr:PTS transporter subunit EIIB [Erysipelotrichaceae bacterium]MCB9499741.1 PTS transporter subunit EIIB [Erysipelotrichaceae bacterium]
MTYLVQNSANENLFIILGIGVCLVALIIIASIILYVRLHKKTSNVIDVEATISEEDHDNIILALGGEDNIKEHSLVGTRLTLVLNDYSKVNKEDLKKYGVERTLEMSNKLILVGKKLDNLNNSLDDIKRL